MGQKFDYYHDEEGPVPPRALSAGSDGRERVPDEQKFAAAEAALRAEFPELRQVSELGKSALTKLLTSFAAQSRDAAYLCGLMDDTSFDPRDVADIALAYSSVPARSRTNLVSFHDERPFSIAIAGLYLHDKVLKLITGQELIDLRRWYHLWMNTLKSSYITDVGSTFEYVRAVMERYPIGMTIETERIAQLRSFENDGIPEHRRIWEAWQRRLKR